MSLVENDCSAPLVSVILVVKNGERFLYQAIESVLASTYTNIELLVIDGHSTDNSVQIAGSFPQVTLIKQHGEGIAGAYNQGISLSSGALVSFISADDLWSEEKLQSQVAHLSHRKDLQLVVGKALFFLEEGCSPPPGFRTVLLHEPRTAYIMETLLVRKEVFEMIGTFDTTLETAEDVDWFARARDAGIKSDALDEIVVHKRVHDQNSSMSKANTLFLIRALKKSAERKRERAKT